MGQLLILGTTSNPQGIQINILSIEQGIDSRIRPFIIEKRKFRLFQWNALLILKYNKTSVS